MSMKNYLACKEVKEFKYGIKFPLPITILLTHLLTHQSYDGLTMRFSAGVMSRADHRQNCIPEVDFLY